MDKENKFWIQTEGKTVIKMSNNEIKFELNWSHPEEDTWPRRASDPTPHGPPSSRASACFSQLSLATRPLSTWRIGAPPRQLWRKKKKATGARTVLCSKEKKRKEKKKTKK